MPSPVVCPSPSCTGPGYHAAVKSLFKRHTPFSPISVPYANAMQSFPCNLSTHCLRAFPFTVEILPQLLDNPHNRNAKCNQPRHETNEQYTIQCFLPAADSRIVRTRCRHGDVGLANRCQRLVVACPSRGRRGEALFWRRRSGGRG
jgi:hypothetical protein